VRVVAGRKDFLFFFTKKGAKPQERKKKNTKNLTE
jgi:hypothetical protein